eukprot:TRINITY_DN64633_c0_g1_i1.p1 TRINITY_DN64633_c0_g1~~TRINITY_DN64633_c0_g1_i1.p1  ORF type:complete len:494 (-),score=76.47 TRINITY_DN64633_c0_g1_i1:412-1893(-)
MSVVEVTAGEQNVKIPTGLFINGEFVESVSGKKFSTTNPATEAVICEVFEGDKADVDKAVEAGKKAFPGWARTGGAKRGQFLNKIADALEAQQKAFAAIETLDNGKAIADSADIDLPGTIQVFRYYAGWADKITSNVYNTCNDHLDFTRREPFGVCAAIIPWNYPLAMLSWKVAPALACGNVVVLKSSEKTPLTALMFAQVCKDVGLPAGVFNLISGFGPTAGAAMASHMDIPKIAFTGSTATGRQISILAAQSNLKKVTLELGGKSPVIVCDDADVDTAAFFAASAVFANQGQVCTAGTRTFVHEKIYDEFVEKFVCVAQNTMLGDPFDEITQQGPQVDKLQFDRIMGYIEAGKKEGATLKQGGERFGSQGYFIQPTVFTDVKDDHKIAREEIFGPVACIFKFSTDEEAVARANDTQYGLAAGIFSKNLDRALWIERNLQAGTVWINEYGDEHVQMPFGGFKQSGSGRELGTAAIEEYTQLKSVRCKLSKPW